MLNRKIIFDKITALQENKITPEDMYGWVLSIVVTPEYETSTQEDPLIHASLQDLMNITQASNKRRPPEELLEYYRRCLSGQEEYDEAQALTLSTKAYAKSKGVEQEGGDPGSSNISLNFKSSYKKSKRGFGLVLRAYIYLFALCIIGIHLASILNPELLFYYEEAGETNKYIMTEAIPHVTYAFILLVPFHWLVRNPWLFFSLPAMIFGTFYYWRISLELIMKLSLHQFFILIVLPFGAIPATLALVLLLIEWKQSRR